MSQEDCLWGKVARVAVLLDLGWDGDQWRCGAGYFSLPSVSTSQAPTVSMQNQSSVEMEGFTFLNLMLKTGMLVPWHVY